MPSYAGTKSQSGNQSQLSINTGTVASPTWTLVGEVSEVTQSGSKNKSEDATNLESQAEEFVPTIPTPGNYGGTMNRISGDAGQQAMNAAFTSVPPGMPQFKFQLPKNSTQTTQGDYFVFTALVEEFNDIGKITPTGIVKTQFSLKISGPIAKTQGS
jgi:hypothetical protein